MKYVCSRYPELSFYVDGEIKTFSNGEYITKDKKEIEVLNRISDVVEEKNKKVSDE